MKVAKLLSKNNHCETITDLWLLCSNEMKEYPQLSAAFYYESLKQGGANLESESQITSFIGYWGLFYAFLHSYPFDNFPYTFFENKEINIIEYGCGLAFGSMIYSHYTYLSCYKQHVNNITLIEPSELLLKRAALHASMFCPEANIKTVNKQLDKLEQNDIVCNKDIPTLHIFSDVLEKTNYDMDRLAYLIKNSVKGTSQFLCIQLYFDNYHHDNMINKFASYFTANFDIDCVPQYDMERIVNRDYPILKGTTCAYTTFTKYYD